MSQKKVIEQLLKLANKQQLIICKLAEQIGIRKVGQDQSKMEDIEYHSIWEFASKTGFHSQYQDIMSIRGQISPDGQLVKIKITFDLDANNPQESRLFDDYVNAFKKVLINQSVEVEGGKTIKVTNNPNNIQIDYNVEDVIG